VDRLLDSTKIHEGLRLKAYKDTVGVWTIGYGTNLQTLEIEEPLAAEWLAKKLGEAQTFAQTLPEWATLSDIRRAVVVEMIYNLGPHGYHGFVNTRRAMAEGRYQDASNGMLASRWALQVGRRARRLAAQMREGRPWQELQVE
jgi:lysozyme